MDYILFPASERGISDYGRLQANYSFSFASYYDLDKMGFGLLRVLNDDTIAAGKWFPPHGHENMEIITIPQSWALEHKDNTWWHGIVRVGDVQVMSAGSWVEHSEYNASDKESAVLFQLWIDTKIPNIEPRYDQKSFGNVVEGSTALLVSNDGRQGSLVIHQDAFISRATIGSGKTADYSSYIKGNAVYILLISGSIRILDCILWPKDAIGFMDIGDTVLSIEAEKGSDVLFIEVPKE